MHIAEHAGARTRAAARGAGTDASRARERGMFTMVEVLLATVILALSATATAYWVEMVGNLSEDADEQTVALAAVQVLEAMLTPLQYREGETFGPEGSETLADYDDLDDFHGLASNPPLDGNRQAQAGLAGWQTLITVEDVDPVTLLPAAGSDLRRVKVVVTHDGRAVTESWWLRARSPLE